MASRFHILIVEDEPLIVEVLEGTLEAAYRVSSANTVGQALAFLRTSHVDLILLDSILPDGRSAEVASAAERLGAVVIQMSGYPQVMGEFQCSERLFLCKPFGPELLLTTIEAALHNGGEADTATL
jgi:DNA-binding NtrC family response regulator